MCVLGVVWWVCVGGAGQRGVGALARDRASVDDEHGALLDVGGAEVDAHVDQEVDVDDKVEDGQPVPARSPGGALVRACVYPDARSSGCVSPPIHLQLHIVASNRYTPNNNQYTACIIRYISDNNLEPPKKGATP